MMTPGMTMTYTANGFNGFNGVNLPAVQFIGRVAAMHPSSLDTNCFAKGGDHRDVSGKPDAAVAALCFEFLLQLPSMVEINELVLKNRP